MPIGVHVISARAELVEEDDRKVGNELSDTRHKKRVVCLLGFLVVAFVAFVVTVPAVLITQNNKQKKKVIVKGPPCGGKNRHDCILASYSSDESSLDSDLYDDENNDFPIRDKIKDAMEDKLETYLENKAVLEDTNASASIDSPISPLPQLFLQSVRYKDHSFSDDDESISVTIQGIAFECTNI